MKVSLKRLPRQAVLVLLALCCVFPAIALPQDVVQSGGITDNEAVALAAAAASAYERGDFPEAEAAYRRLVATGRDSAAALYNLGNSLYRLGRTGEAILAWEKARRLDPADTAIRANLTFAQGRITDLVAEPAQESDPLGALWQWHGRVPAGVATAVFLAVWWGFHICLAGALFLNRQRLKLAASYLLPLALLGVLCSALVLGGLVYRRDVVVEGIVLPARSDLVSGPGEGAVRLTTVHEGLKVRLHSRRGDWLEVLLPNGLRGWLPAEAVGTI